MKIRDTSLNSLEIGEVSPYLTIAISNELSEVSPYLPVFRGVPVFKSVFRGG